MIFADGLFVGRNRSPKHPKWDVAPESAMMEGMSAAVACVVGV